MVGNQTWISSQSRVSLRNGVKLTEAHSVTSPVKPAIQNVARLIYLTIPVVTEQLHSLSRTRPVQILQCCTWVNQRWGFRIRPTQAIRVLASEKRCLLKLTLILLFSRSREIVLQIFSQVMNTVVDGIQFAGVGCVYVIRIAYFIFLKLSNFCNCGSIFCRCQKIIQWLVGTITSQIWGNWRDRRYVELTVVLQSNHLLPISVCSL